MASIKQINDRKFKITVSNGYRADGRKICKAKTITVPDSVTKRGIHQYVAHAAEEMERLIKDGFAEDGEMTFEEYANRWLDRQVKYAPGTIGSYRRMLNRVYPFIGTIQLNKLRPLALENMLTHLRKRENHGKPIRETTVQRYLTVVSAVLSDAKRNEIIPKNPARMIDLPDTEKREQFIPTEADATRFLYALKKEPWHYLIFYLLAIYTGCRRGELCALKWTDIEFANDETLEMVITISHSRSVVAGKGVVEGATKNGKTRIICVNEDMGALLATYFLRRKRQILEKRIKYGDYLFTDDEGNLIHPDTFTKHLRTIFKKNGFPKTFHLHTLRHYFVSTLLHHGVDKQTVAELAGHADTSFLEKTYCHPQLDLKRKAAVVIGDVLISTEERQPA
ncbi:MAG: site-specific integrase [Acutalibacter sp.]|nr:site-specific integrase [Acutalibacter sp.]